MQHLRLLHHALALAADVGGQAKSDWRHALSRINIDRHGPLLLGQAERRASRHLNQPCAVLLNPLVIPALRPATGENASPPIAAEPAPANGLRNDISRFLRASSCCQSSTLAACCADPRLALTAR